MEGRSTTFQQHDENNLVRRTTVYEILPVLFTRLEVTDNLLTTGESVPKEHVVSWTC